MNLFASYVAHLRYVRTLAQYIVTSETTQKISDRRNDEITVSFRACIRVHDTIS